MSAANIKAAMVRTFANFWDISLGNIIVAVVVAIGWSMEYQHTKDVVVAVDVAAQVRDEANHKALDSAVNERNLKISSLENEVRQVQAGAQSDVSAAAQQRQLQLSALTARVERTEGDVRAVTDLKTQVAVIATQLTSLNKTVEGWRLDMREQLGIRLNAAGPH